MVELSDGKEQTLEARQVSVRFEGLTAVDSVDEILHQGEILGLIGPNGAGKTTLVNAMTGFQVPASGEVLLEVRLTGTKPSNIAFGGPDGRTCYVTVADHGNVETFRADRPGRSWQLYQKRR